MTHVTMKKTILSAIAFTAVAIAGAQTTHNLIVEDTEGKKTSFPKADVAGIVFQEMPAYTEANTLIQAQYSTVENRRHAGGSAPYGPGKRRPFACVPADGSLFRGCGRNAVHHKRGKVGMLHP